MQVPRDNPVYNSSLNQAMEKTRNNKSLAEDDFFWLTSELQLILKNFPIEVILPIITRHVELMNEYQISHSRDWALYVLMTHCGALGQPLRDECSKHVLSSLFKQEQWEESPGMFAYRHSIGSQLDGNLSAREEQGVMLSTTMRLVWYVDRMLNFHGMPKYRLSTIGRVKDRHSFTEWYPVFDESERYLHDLLVYGLKPGRIYILWYFDNLSGEWKTLEPRYSHLTVPDGYTTIQLKSFPVAGSFGISVEGQPGPDNFFHLLRYGISEGESAVEVSNTLSTVVMPPTLWPQQIFVVPSVLEQSLKIKSLYFYKQFMQP